MGTPLVTLPLRGVKASGSPPLLTAGPAFGTVLAFELSTRLGLCPPEETARVRRHFGAIGLPTGLEFLSGRVLSADTLVRHMERDKKVQDGRVTYVLARGIGRAFLSRDVELADVAALLNSALGA